MLLFKFVRNSVIITICVGAISGCMGLNANTPASSAGNSITLMPIIDMRSNKTDDIDTIGMIEGSVQKELTVKGYSVDIVSDDSQKPKDRVKSIGDKNALELSRQVPAASDLLLYVYLKDGVSSDGGVYKFSTANVGAMIVKREPPKILWSNEEEKAVLLVGVMFNGTSNDQWTRAKSVSRTVNALFGTMPDSLR